MKFLSTCIVASLATVLTLLGLISIMDRPSGHIASLIGMTSPRADKYPLSPAELELLRKMFDDGRVLAQQDLIQLIVSHYDTVITLLTLFITVFTAFLYFSIKISSLELIKKELPEYMSSSSGKDLLNQSVNNSLETNLPSYIEDAIAAQEQTGERLDRIEESLFQNTQAALHALEDRLAVLEGTRPSSTKIPAKKNRKGS